MYEEYENARNRTPSERSFDGRSYSARPGEASGPDLGARPDAPREKRRLSGWRKGALIYCSVLFGIILIGFAFRAMFSGLSDGAAIAPDSPYIARINVVGTISGEPDVDFLGNVSGYDHEWTLACIDDLIRDDNNRGLIIFVDSPGGGVYESDELYLKLREYADGDGTKRPVYAVMGSMAASGGYYVSVAAERIYANRNTWTGSIGVTMGTLFDVSEFLDRHGVKTETVTSGRNKAMGGLFDPITDEQKAIFQGLIDEAYTQFTGIVAKERALDPDYVRDLADGRIYTAAQAVDNGLVDNFGDLETALYDMRSGYDLFSCELVEFNYDNDSLFGRLLGTRAEKSLSAALSRFSGLPARESGDLDAVLRLAESRVPTPQYIYGP
jgi:protease-4